MNKATLILFNAIQVKSKDDKNHTQAQIKRTLKNGYLLAPSIQATASVMNQIEDIIGISGERANAAFHKSWDKVQNASMEQLVFEQLMHYLTTYGYDALGIDGPTFIPFETLEIPEIKSMPITFVRGLTEAEILDEIVHLGSAGIALSTETLDYMMEIIKANNYASDFVKYITNRELKARLYEYFDLVPEEPVEYLRYVITKLTGQSLLIKNDQLINQIKTSVIMKNKELNKYLKQAPDNLAEIFFRYKPLFLALKYSSNNKTFFNQLRKKANKMHKPLGVDYLNDITNQLKYGALDFEKFQAKLKDAAVWRKIRLAYALNYRLNNPEAIVYKVRNGRGMAMPFTWEGDDAQSIDALELVVNSIIEDLKKNIEGKTFYIPDAVHYALPATEKQFTGNLPSGSYVAVPEDAIVGVHWFNTEAGYTDLDLSVVSATGKIGWDAGYRNGDRTVLFSGDMTNAPRPEGATELFYIKKDFAEPMIMNVNYFNYKADYPVDCKILIGHEKVSRLEHNYMIDPNKIMGQAMIKIDKKETTLGLIVREKDETRLYFAATSTGNGITASYSDKATYTRQYYEASVKNSIDLKDLMVKAGATVFGNSEYEQFKCTEIAEGEEVINVIDLSPEALTKSSIIDLFKK